MRDHVRIVGCLFLVYGGLVDTIAVVVGLVVAGGGLLSGDPQAMSIAAIATVAVVSVLLVLSIPGFIAGFGLLRFHAWARILAIILAVLRLVSFPIGTALAIYSLWVLLNTETAPLFETPAPRAV